MTVYLRPYALDTDCARLAAQMTLVGFQPVTEAELREREELWPEGRIRFRVVAVATTSEGEQLAGYGETGRDLGMAPGFFWIHLLVAPAMRRQGIGAMLYDDLIQFAWEQGATRLIARVGEHT